MMKARVTVWPLVILVSALAMASDSAAQRLDVRGLSRVSVSGAATMGEHSVLTATGGFSRFTHSGLEYGGDVVAAYAGGGTTGALFARVSQNFIGESLTVPFVTGGVGTGFGGLGGFVYDAGGGIRRFTSDQRSSFDFMATWRGGRRSGGTAALRVGLSFYFGGA